ncbi:dihydroorotase [Niallia nealsonii]|uniref:Amidohydrolase-related domain-containing protein n=1 Tax=Niallia nealsonii TaxID=115979 RepID=A0A2N0Z5J5_9BACI|nr:dihydroorotase [Niallia nealsonii]PKG24769.1 hypothetical protein CWS01_05850 [Niallia nealsonii]
MEKFEKVVKGNIVLEDRVINGAVGVNNGKIEKIVMDSKTIDGEEVLDFTDKFVFPGIIDVHVHCYSNTEEGFIPTSSAAAAGGVTTFMDMPYDRPAPINNVEIFKEKVERLKEEAIVDIGLWATISKKDGTDQIKPLSEAGAMAFKMSTFETDEFRFPRIPDLEIMEAMEQLRELGIRAAFHAENDEIIYGLIEKYEEEGKVYPAAHMETRPPISETTAVLKLLEFAYFTKSPLHIVHVSHPRTIELIQLYKAQGVNVTLETCYPYLMLDVTALEKYGPKAKNNPPLRLPEEVQGLWEKLSAHHINLISSDHAPWPYQSKEIGNDNIFKATSGMPGLDVMVPLMFDSAVNTKKITPVEFAKLMSTHPAEVFSIPSKGKIKEGYDADFTVIDPTETFIVDETKFHSNAKLSPFDGYEGKGKVAQTIIRGEVVFDGEKIVVEPGFGNFVKGSAYKGEELVVTK